MKTVVQMRLTIIYALFAHSFFENFKTSKAAKKTTKLPNNTKNTMVFILSPFLKIIRILITYSLQVK